MVLGTIKCPKIQYSRIYSESTEQFVKAVPFYTYTWEVHISNRHRDNNCRK